MASSPNHFNQSSAAFNSQATAVSLSNFSTMSSPLCRSRLHHKPKPQLPRRSSQTLCHSSIQKLKSSPLLQFRAHQPPLIHALTPRSPDATAEPRSSAASIRASAAKFLGIQTCFNHHLLNSEPPQPNPEAPLPRSAPLLPNSWASNRVSITTYSIPSRHSEAQSDCHKGRHCAVAVNRFINIRQKLTVACHSCAEKL
jgi:hypothetical protein